MEEILQHIQEVLGVPEFLISQCTFCLIILKMLL